MPAFTAEWILPIGGTPIARGFVAVEDGRIIGGRSGRASRAPTDLGRVAVLPALVNAHTHLELSYLHAPGAAEPRVSPTGCGS